MIDPSTWNDLRARSARNLRGDFSARVLHRAARAQKMRTELLAAAVTLALCLSSTGLIATWNAHTSHQASLARWRELATVTATLEQSL